MPADTDRPLVEAYGACVRDIQSRDDFLTVGTCSLAQGRYRAGNAAHRVAKIRLRARVPTLRQLVGLLEPHSPTASGSESRLVRGDEDTKSCRHLPLLAGGIHAETMRRWGSRAHAKPMSLHREISAGVGLF